MTEAPEAPGDHDAIARLATPPPAPRSLALSLYLAYSARAERRAEGILARRLAAGKEHPERFPERKGIASVPRPDGQLIWFHAASVGEALSIVELLKRLSEEAPDLTSLVTTGTVTSARILANRLPERAIHQFVPLDVLPWVRRFLDHWKPDLAVWTESELWPALIAETSARGVPMVLLNARMSKRSARRWRWLRGMSRALLTRFHLIMAQDAETERRLRSLGARADGIEVTGTLKEGSSALPVNQTEHDALAQLLAGRPVWVAASTHDGEEALVAQAHRFARRAAHRLLLIIVPRHPERGPDIAEALAADGWQVALRSRDEEPDAETQIYVADTLGELGLWYRLAPISFVGGSLAPVGGHNPFEPAALGSAIIHGPNVENFRDVYERFGAAGATIEVTSAEELGNAVVELLAPDRAAAMAHAAWEVCSSGAEVTDRAVEVLLTALDAPLLPPEDR
ncbi:MAG: 3-deoxy-D-manno-octulosonic acid transferase [Alphaproteobacteria bacterium]|nr:MAG: 3-deoxy-D-manno-octulosonic acid transferase [Alphaproteobacteria bacterium]